MSTTSPLGKRRASCCARRRRTCRPGFAFQLEQPASAIWNRTHRRRRDRRCAGAVARPFRDRDGVHLAVVDHGTPFILRERSGDYVRSLMAEASGFDGDPADLGSAPYSSCSKNACVALIRKGATEWRLLATRSATLIDWTTITNACSAADIVVSDRRLPRGCTPQMAEARSSTLRQTGGVAIYLGSNPQVNTVADRVGDHPWAEVVPTGTGNAR